MKNIYRTLLAACGLISLFSCVRPSGEITDPDHLTTYRGNVVSVEHVCTTTKEAIMNGLGADAKIDSLHFDQKIKYDVDCYKITYYTQYGLKGSKVRVPSIVKAQSLLIIPQGVEETRLAAYFHGTVLAAHEITQLLNMGLPTDYTGGQASQDVRHCALPLAASGFCVICPDYTGYGPTADRDHPFVYYPELFLSAYDGVVSAVRVMSDAKYNINRNPGKDLWVSGWSQGGGMALYFQREVEKNYSFRFNIKATSTLAGPFNVTRFLMEMFNNPDKMYLMMALYGWAGYAINAFAVELQRPLDQIFRPAIYDQNDAFLLFGNTPRDLFQGFFIQHLQDGTDPVFMEVLANDSTSEGWDPQAPVFLHHGEKDSIVPCFNSEDAYAGLKDRGDVSFFKYKGQDHATFVPTYISKTIEEFNSVL